MHKQPDSTVLGHELGELAAELKRLIEVFTSSKPLWRGNVYTIRRRCGHPNCHCADGDLHVSTVISDRTGEKPRTLALHGEDVDRFHRMTQRYGRFQHARARVKKIAAQIVHLADALCAIRLQATLSAEKKRKKRE
jgi:hypothetical protein